MTFSDIIGYISNLTSHVTFTYNGYSCGIDPISDNEFIMWYGENERIVKSIDEVKSEHLFGGKTFADIWNDIAELDY